MYSTFEEIILAPTMRDWIGWNDEASQATHTRNMERLFAWMSKDEDEFSTRSDTIITSSTDIQTVAEFINDEKALQKMEETRSVSKAYASSEWVKGTRYEESLDQIEQQINEALHLFPYARIDSKERIKGLIAKVNSLASASGFTEILENKAIKRHVLFTFKTDHFSTLHIKNYKLLQGLQLENLRQINLIAGINNTGKSSLLEAIYLLTQQNDIYSFFEVNRRRSKFGTALNSVWLNEQPLTKLEIAGVFDQKEVSIVIEKGEEENEALDKNAYLSTLYVSAKLNDERYKSHARIYKGKENEAFFKSIQHLCNAVYSSPFALQNKEDIITYHEKSVESKSVERIISFLRDKVDTQIRDIELAGELKRFLVNHADFEKAIDLTHFGEGMQRIFHIGLQFAAAQNGVLLVDEMENAVHHSLLKDFARLIRELAAEFHVQVFITSHSKECLDAFLAEGQDNSKVSGYRLVKQDNKMKCQYVSGEKLAQLIDAIDLDLRGGP